LQQGVQMAQLLMKKVEAQQCFDEQAEAPRRRRLRGKGPEERPRSRSMSR
jgi:hypothetical protein